MDAVSPEELISLYFDGAATPEERQQAELLLAQSEAARTWLSQLEQMRADMKTLPRQTMPADCLAKVMRRAEQQMLRRGRGGDEPSFAAADSGGGWPIHSRRQLWAAMAVAAAALMVVVLPAYFSRRGPAGEVALEQRDANSTTASEVAKENADREVQKLKAKTIRELQLPDEGASARSESHAARSVSAKRGARNQFDEAPERGTLGIERKMAPAESVAGGPEAAEKAQATYFSTAALAGAQGANTQSLSYVYNVPTPEAQQVVLKTFEQTLREQQIVLEDSIVPSPTDPEAAGRPGGGRNAAFGAMFPAVRQLGQSPDCVFVIEATPLQLSNTLSTLDNMTTPSSGERPAGQASARELARDKNQLVEATEKRSSGLAAADRAVAAPGPGQVSPAAGNLTRLNRSQAIRLSTDFADQSSSKGSGVQNSITARTGQTAGVMPAEPKLSKDLKTPVAAAATAPAAPPVPTAAPAAILATPQIKQQLNDALPGETDQRAANLQRAVIIFRVVPESAPKPAETSAKP